MKISVEIEATPREVRDTLGLPDVQAVQDRVIAKIEGKVMGAVDDHDPTKLLRTLIPEGLGVLEGWQKALLDAVPTGRKSRSKKE